MLANAKLARVSDTLDVDGNTVEPVTLADAKGYLNVQIAADDALLADMIASARMECEADVNRSFITTTWDYTIDLFPGGGYGYLSALASVLPGYGGWGSGPGWDIDLSAGAIQLPMPPLIDVVSMAYVDLAGVAQTIDVAPIANRVIISPGTPGRIVPAFGGYFPFTRPTTGAIVIRYTAGYGADPKLVPAVVRQGIRLLMREYYQPSANPDAVRFAVSRNLDPIRWGAY